jgi:hypothetical protein
MPLLTDTAMMGAGVLLGGMGAARLPRRWAKGLLVAGPAGILSYLGWVKWDLGPGILAACALLGAFVVACDRLCVVPRQRRIFLLLCGAAATLFLSQTWGRFAALRALGAGAVQDGVVLQSTGFSCLPASAATCLLSLGIPATEASLADEARTTLHGTGMGRMLPPLARRLQGTGWQACQERRTWETLPRDGSPAVLAVDWHGIPHVIAFLGFEGNLAVIGEPLEGRVLRTREALARDWDGEGIFFARR